MLSFGSLFHNLLGTDGSMMCPRDSSTRGEQYSSIQQRNTPTLNDHLIRHDEPNGIGQVMVVAPEKSDEK